MQKTRLKSTALIPLFAKEGDSSLAIKRILSHFSLLLLMQKTRLKLTALIPLFSKEGEGEIWQKSKRSY